MSAARLNEQHAPWPSDLEALVAMVRYRDGWRFGLEDIERDPADTHGADAGGLTLVIATKTANSYHQRQCEACRSTVTDYRVNHYFIVPAATWGREAWLAWLMDRIEDVESHEAREFFRLEHTEIVPTPAGLRGRGEGLIVERPFAPNHGPGRDPYRRYSYATDEDRRTSFRGTVQS